MTTRRTVLPWTIVALAATLLASALAPPARAEVTDAADPAFWYGRAADGSPTIKVHFFWTNRCANCRAAKPFMEALPERLPFVELVSRPTEGSPSNARLQYATATALGADPTSVPAIFFCGEAQIGYDDARGAGASLVRRLEACRARLAADPSLLTKPVPVIPKEQRASADGGAGTVVAIVIAAAFVGLVVLGVVLSRRAAAAKARQAAARHGERSRRKKR